MSDRRFNELYVKSLRKLGFTEGEIRTMTNSVGKSKPSILSRFKASVLYYWYKFVLSKEGLW